MAKQFLRLVLGAALFTFACSALANTSAVTPVSGAVSERLNTADAVVLLQIEQVGNLVLMGPSEPGMLVTDGRSYTGDVIKTWKGEDLDLIDFRVYFNACVERLNTESQYLIFAHKSKEGFLQLNSCDDVVKHEEGEALASTLDGLLLADPAKKS